MSLVGPRPLFDTDTKLFNKDYMRRLNVLPGMTGLLQINKEMLMILKLGFNMMLNILKTGIYY